MDFNYRPTSRLLSPADIQAERQALMAGQQKNALLQMQMEDAQNERVQRRNALMQQQQLRESLPSPLGQANQVAFAQPGQLGPTRERAAAQPAVDQRLQMLYQGMRAGGNPMDYIKAANPEPEFKVVGDSLVRIGGGNVTPAYTATPKPAAPPSSVAEYNFAKTQGYGGTYEQWVKEKARAGASSTSVNYSTPVEAVDLQGNRVFIRTTKDGMTPAIIPGVRPPMSAAEERAASERATRERQGQQMVSGIEDARSILDAGRATGSGFGNLVDAGARLIGQTTVGAQDAARLETLSGWLVANVPRMEGPQSNIDVQNYTTMAGKIGDRTVPIKERKAALTEVERLQRKYAAINGTPMPNAPPAGAVRRYNPATGKIE